MFCRNCGKDVGNSRFCSNCGTAVADATPTVTMSNNFSNYYPLIHRYEQDARTAFVLSILSLVFCMGIGLIFEIICWVKIMKMVPVLENGITNPIEIAMIQNARRKLMPTLVMWCIAFTITSVLLFVIIMGGLILWQTS